jgi:hypothetical protein
MRGVDVADHLRGNYTTQVHTHKWWHRVFFFLLDVTVTNMYIMYIQILQRLGRSEEGITHLQFRNGLAQALSQNWGLEIVRVLWNCLDTPRFIIQGIQLFGGNVSVAESGAIFYFFYVVGDGCV